jgi:hypothetical protein
MQGLRFFNRDSGGGMVLASWHSPHSMTWRWLLAFRRFKGDEWRAWPLWWSYRDNNGLQWGARLPWWGILGFSQQRPMWYRDLYHRKRDEVDNLRDELSRPRPNKPPQSPFNPVVIDGGQSLH